VLSANDAQPALPKNAIHPSFGKCRVLSYEGNNYFTILTPRKNKVFCSRKVLTFTR
jgi:hypothetical protein